MYNTAFAASAVGGAAPLMCRLRRLIIPPGYFWQKESAGPDALWRARESMRVAP